jgi:hypothetical protein
MMDLCAHLHWCGDCDIGNSNMVACDPLVLTESSLENPGTSVELVRLCIDCLLVGFTFHEWLHNILDQVDIARRKP